LEGLDSSDASEREKATKNVAACMALATYSPEIIKATMGKELIDLLESPESIERKCLALLEAKEKRAAARKVETAAYLDYSDYLPQEDFSSITTDMSDIATLYDLTAEILLNDSTHLSQLGFTKDQDGLCVLLAALKAVDTSNAAALEEAFTSWWHAGQGRFSLQPGHANKEDRSSRKLLVVFSSLGSGIARPEWSGSLRNVVESNDNLDVLNVLDPAFSWYCQDPSCQWKGGEYYDEELRSLVQDYQGVMFLGDSMGGAAALRFSALATHVLAFTPQVDITTYEAITRNDFSVEDRNQFQQDVVIAVQQANADITIHYGEHCEEDVRHVNLLPRERVHLIAHDFDDHILSLRLRELGKLQGIIEDAVNQFLQN
jgi:hypothetical protein